MAGKGTEPTHSCEICGLEGLKEDDLRKHVIGHVGASCPFCDISGVSADEMLVHVNTTHLDYLTPENEYFSFIDDDEDDDISQSSLQASIKMPSTNGWSEKVFPISNINNNNEFEASCSRSHSQNSPSRKLLNLNLQTNIRPAMPEPLPRHDCFMCSYTCTTPLELEEHINRAHFDLTSPSLTATDLQRPLKNYHCPFCIHSSVNTPDLELHVNLEHKDILSPAKPCSSTSTDDWSERCPVCCRSNFRNNKEMVSHIEAHFDYRSEPSTPATPDLSTDRLLAREMERHERESLRAREQREFELLRAQYGMDNQGNFKEQSLTNMQKAVYAGEMSVSDYYERKVELHEAEYSGIDDGSSCTKGLIQKVRQISSSSPTVVKAFFCTTVDHYASTYGDKGWGCGYRNVQMMISSLIHHTGFNEQLYKPAIPGGGLFGCDSKACAGRSAVPSISRLQQHIEWSWRQGFDTQGAEQLDGKLHNTRKWIGATEVVTALSSLRIRCQLVDFHQPTSDDGSHPELFNWVLQYFQRQDEFKPPLYLQHQGHSRTIVGVEKHRDGHVVLIVFDPSHSPQQMAQLKSNTGAVSGMRLIRKSSAAMKARHYQLVAVCGIMEAEQEYQESKVLRSIRVPSDR